LKNLTHEQMEVEKDLVKAYMDKDVDTLISYIRGYQQVLKETADELHDLKYTFNSVNEGVDEMRLNKEEGKKEEKLVLPVFTVSSDESPSIAIRSQDGALKAECPTHGVTNRLICVNRAIFCAACVETALCNLIKPLELYESK